MVWVKLDDRFAEHPKVASLSDAAFRAHVAALCYCARNETDGKIPARVAEQIGGSGELESAGLWHRNGAGYEIHDFLAYNPSAASIREKREQAAERMRRVRANSERTSQEPASTPSPPPSPIPEPPEYRNPTGSSSAGADQTGLAEWFIHAWNDHANGLPAVRQIGKERMRGVRGILKAAGGDRERVERAIRAFAAWSFAREKELGADTFLRAKSRDKHLEWAENGPPSGDGSASIDREIMRYAERRFGNAGHLDQRR